MMFPPDQGLLWTSELRYAEVDYYKINPLKQILSLKPSYPCMLAILDFAAWVPPRLCHRSLSQRPRRQLGPRSPLRPLASFTQGYLPCWACWETQQQLPLVSGSYQLSESFLPSPRYYIVSQLLEQLGGLLFFQICVSSVHLRCSSLFMPSYFLLLAQDFSSPQFLRLLSLMNFLEHYHPAVTLVLFIFFHGHSVLYVPDVPVFSLSPARPAHLCNLNTTRLQHLLQKPTFRCFQQCC